jgi:hypothetical protein
LSVSLARDCNRDRGSLAVQIFARSLLTLPGLPGDKPPPPQWGPSGGLGRVAQLQEEARLRRELATWQPGGRPTPVILARWRQRKLQSTVVKAAQVRQPLLRQLPTILVGALLRTLPQEPLQPGRPPTPVSRVRWRQRRFQSAFARAARHHEKGTETSAWCWWALVLSGPLSVAVSLPKLGSLAVGLVSSFWPFSQYPEKPQGTKLQLHSQATVSPITKGGAPSCYVWSWWRAPVCELRGSLFHAAWRGALWSLFSWFWMARLAAHRSVVCGPWW